MLLLLYEIENLFLIIVINTIVINCWSVAPWTHCLTFRRPAVAARVPDRAPVGKEGTGGAAVTPPQGTPSRRPPPRTPRRGTRQERSRSRRGRREANSRPDQILLFGRKRQEGYWNTGLKKDARNTSNWLPCFFFKIPSSKERKFVLSETTWIALYFPFFAVSIRPSFTLTGS